MNIGSATQYNILGGRKQTGFGIFKKCFLTKKFLSGYIKEKVICVI